MTKRKVLVVTFVPIGGDPSGPANVAMALALSLHRQDRLLGLICPSFDPDELDIPPRLVHSPPHPHLQKLLALALRLLGRILPVNERRIRESTFDYFLSKSRWIRSAEAVLFLKPAFPRSASSASARGASTFAWASVLHPRFNSDQVLAQRRIWETDGASAYTAEKRIHDLEKFFRSVDHVLVGSEVAKASYIAGGIPEEKLHLLAGTFAIDCDRFRPEEGTCEKRTFRALHVSQMNLIKGVGYLLDAWSRLSLQSAELVLIGDMEEGIETIFHRIKPPRTTALGFLADVSSHYREADVFVSPSVADLHPYTVLEAMASGTPVIVSDRCGVSTIVEHGVNGFVYPYDDTDSLAEHIRWCHEHPNELKEMGSAARTSALQCTHDIFTTKVIAEIDQCFE